MIFGVSNPIGICHQQLIDLLTSPVGYRHSTFGSQKKSFFNRVDIVIQQVH